MSREEYSTNTAKIVVKAANDENFNTNTYNNSTAANNVDYNNSYNTNNTNGVYSANNSNINNINNNNKNNNNSNEEAPNSQANNQLKNNEASNNNNNNNNNNNENFTNKEGRMINGVLYPKAERKIDVQGYETTKHALRFHGSDWDIPLTQKRDDLTKSLIQGAAEATGEPEENIQNVRFVVNTTYLYTKFTVRHKINVSITEVQKKLAEGKWTAIKELYEPRQKKSHASSERTHNHSSLNNKSATDKRQSTSALSHHGHRQNNNSSSTNQTKGATTVGSSSVITVNTPVPMHNISFFGRANVGTEGPTFVDDIDRDEEPPNFQDPEVIRMRSKSEHIVIPYGLPA